MNVHAVFILTFTCTCICITLYMYYIVYIYLYMYHMTIGHTTYLYSCVYVSRDTRSHDLPEGLSLASEVNLQTVDMSMLDHSLNWDHHCSTATANGGGGGGEREGERGREGGRENKVYNNTHTYYNDIHCLYN